MFRSSNFAAGSAGWRVRGNGDAEFNNVTVRGEIIGTSGTLSGLTVTGTIDLSGSGELVTDTAGQRIEMTSVNDDVITWYDSGGEDANIGFGGGVTGWYIVGPDYAGDGATVGLRWLDSNGDLDIGAVDLGTASTSYITFSKTTTPNENHYFFNLPMEVQAGDNILRFRAYIGLMQDSFTGSVDWVMKTTGSNNFAIEDDDGTVRFAINQNGVSAISADNGDTMMTWDTIAASRPRVEIHEAAAALGTYAQAWPGLLLYSNATGVNDIFPTIQFGSADAQFTTTNPKQVAFVGARATEAYAADTDAGATLIFGATEDNAGATPVPTVVMEVGYDGTDAIVNFPVGLPQGGTGNSVHIDSNEDLFENTSSRRFKTAIDYSYGSGLELINKLRPVRFEYTRLPGDTQHGLIAEDVFKVDPSLVTLRRAGKTKRSKKMVPNGVKYDQLVATLVSAVQELSAKVDALSR
jgi:hypothetical protein